MVELRQLISTLYFVLNTFVPSQHDESEVLSQEHRDILYGGMNDNEFGAELSGIVKKFEDYVRPHLPQKKASKRHSAIRSDRP